MLKKFLDKSISFFLSFAFFERERKKERENMYVSGMGRWSKTERE